MRQFLRKAQVDHAIEYDVGGVFNACLGLAGEVGELNDAVKKMVFHEKEVSEEHLKKELGDVMWYVAQMAHSFHWNLDEIMQMNIDKLRERYPDGFDKNRAHGVMDPEESSSKTPIEEKEGVER